MSGLVGGLKLSFERFERAVMRAAGVKSPCDLTPGIQYWVICGPAYGSWHNDMRAASSDLRLLQDVAWRWTFDQLVDGIQLGEDNLWEFDPYFEIELPWRSTCNGTPPQADERGLFAYEKLKAIWPELYIRLDMQRRFHVRPSVKRPSIEIIKALCDAVQLPCLYKIVKLPPSKTAPIIQQKHKDLGSADFDKHYRRKTLT